MSYTTLCKNNKNHWHRASVRITRYFQCMTSYVTSSKNNKTHWYQTSVRISSYTTLSKNSKNQLHPTSVRISSYVTRSTRMRPPQGPQLCGLRPRSGDGAPWSWCSTWVCSQFVLATWFGIINLQDDLNSWYKTMSRRLPCWQVESWYGRVMELRS